MPRIRKGPQGGKQAGSAPVGNEVADSGFSDVEIFNIEGPGFLVSNFAERWTDPDRLNAMLQAARLVEQEPEMLAAASHLLAVGRA